MTRTQLRLKIGLDYYTSNTENEEFSYVIAFKQQNKSLPVLPQTIQNKFINRTLKFLDLRFESKDLVILIETKKSLKDDDINQLEGYKYYESILNPNKNIVSILYDLTKDKAITYANGNLLKLTEILSFDDYEKLFINQTNNRNKIIEAVDIISNSLEGFIQPFQKALFVGLCLIALNYAYSNLNTTSLLIKQKDKIVLNNFNNKDDLIAVLKNIITLKCQQTEISNEIISGLLDIFSLHDISIFPFDNFLSLLDDILTKIIPYVVLNTYEGDDLLDIFFITFNKYSTRKDKNQTFTPPHIASFMAELLALDENSVVLDPTCGSGTLLMQSEIQMLKDVYNFKQRNTIKSNNIIGIEYELQAYKLALINFLLHNDTKITLMHNSCFNCKDFILKKQVNRVIMNPPFNAFNLPKPYANSNKLIDNSKGLVFFKYAIDLCVGGYACCILPYACLGSIANKKDIIATYRKEILQKHTLKAVITLSSNVFFPSVNYDTCIVLLELNKKHNFKYDEVVFLDGRQDGFVAKENSRIDINNTWKDIKKQWLDIIFKKQSIENLSKVSLINEDDTWLPLNYIENKQEISEADFVKTCKDYLIYLRDHNNTNDNNKDNILDYYEIKDKNNADYFFDVCHPTASFKLGDLFKFETSKVSNSLALQEGNEIDYIAAKKTLNGVKMHCKRIDALVSAGNCISFICAGAGSNGYQNYFYYETMQTKSNVLGYSGFCKLNLQVGLYIVTILNKEAWRWNYGRKRKDELKETKINLPIDKKGNIDYVYINNVINHCFDLVIKEQEEELKRLKEVKKNIK